MFEIEVVNLSKDIRDEMIIDNFNITLMSGQVIGFGGANGCGKTMFLKLLSGMEKPSAGKIFIDERELGKNRFKPTSMGTLIGEPNFISVYSAMDNLKIMSLTNSIADHKRIGNVIFKVGLNPENPRKYEQYSLGMKQRLGIACAIMESPAILILDEPTSALDEAGIKMLREVINEEKEKGALVIIASRNINKLKSLCDEVYIIKDGQLTEKPI